MTMRLVSKAKLFALTLLMGGATVDANAATVTVDPNAGVNTPGVTYLSIIGAMDNLTQVAGPGGGHGWGNGVNDTILLVSTAVHFVTDEISASPYNPDFTPPIAPPPDTTELTVRSAGPGNAILRFKPNFTGQQRVWDIETPGTYLFENITHIGSIDLGFSDPLAADYRTVFRVDADNPGDLIHCTVRNCIVTANNGSEGPRTDYGGAFPAGRAGTFMRAFYNGDGTHEGAFSFVAENCVFAFLANNADLGISGIGSGQGGGIEVFREDALANFFTPNATKEVIFRNCLLANCLDEGVAIDGASHEATLTFEDCLLTNVNDRILKLPNEGDSAWRGGHYNFVHTIIEAASNAIRNPGSRTFDGTINLDEVTIVNPGVDAILLTNQNPGEATFTFSDVIAFGVNSILRLQPDPGANSGPAPAVLTASSIASDAAVLGSQAASVQTTINAAVVTTDSPNFQNTNIAGAINGITSWSSVANELFDVGNNDYAGLGTSNIDLRGGADFIFTVPPQSVEDWKLYE
jgi:hypothetical protein